MQNGSWKHKDLTGKKKIQLKSLNKATIFNRKKSEAGQPVEALTYSVSILYITFIIQTFTVQVCGIFTL